MKHLPEGGSLVLVVLSDGTVIFRERTEGCNRSVDWTECGRGCLRVGRVSQTVIRDCVRRLRSLGFFGVPVEHRDHGGPDAPYLSLLASDGDATVILSSWHELWAADYPYRYRPEFGRFVPVWDKSKGAMQSLVPIESAMPFHGDWTSVYERLEDIAMRN